MAYECLKLRVQLPEIVVAAWTTRRPAGREVICFAQPSRVGAALDARGSVEFVGDHNACNSYHIELSEVRPGDRFEVILRSVLTRSIESLIAQQPPDVMVTYAEGTAEFTRDREPVEIGFLLPFAHDHARRIVRSGAMVADDAALRRVRFFFWGDADL